MRLRKDDAGEVIGRIHACLKAVFERWTWHGLIRFSSLLFCIRHWRGLYASCLWKLRVHPRVIDVQRASASVNAFPCLLPFSSLSDLLQKEMGYLDKPPISLQRRWYLHALCWRTIEENVKSWSPEVWTRRVYAILLSFDHHSPSRESLAFPSLYV
jgi:hypothetical protein